MKHLLNLSLSSPIFGSSETVITSEALIHAIGDGAAIFDADMRIVYQNSAHRALVDDLVGRTCHQAYHDNSKPCRECAVKNSLNDGRVHRMERRIESEEKGVFILESTVSPIKDADGTIVAAIEIVRDVTERKRADEALRESEARYFSLFHGNAAVMLLIDPVSGVIVDANPAACMFYGYPAEVLVGTHMNEINILSTEAIEQKREVVVTESRRYFHFRHRLSNGDIRDVEVFTGPIKVQGRKLLYSIIHDITERKKAEAHIKFLALHDPLTRLANRSLLEDRLNHSLARVRRYKEGGALFFLDLDQFKMINDTLGHAAGDLLLQQVGGRLRETLRSEDTVSRFGGDEFVLLIPKIQNIVDAALVATKIQKTLLLPFTIAEREVHISASMGICLYPHDGCETASLIRNADTAMYCAKKQGRNNFQFFRETMGT